MPYENIKLSLDERSVATLTLARAEKLNALSVAMMREIHLALDELAAAKELRALIVTAEGNMFCAGGDINMFKAMAGESREVRLQAAMRGITLAEKIAALSVPVIGRINGPAYGGAISIVAACDITIR